MAKKKSKGGLGRGLSALMADIESEPVSTLGETDGPTEAETTPSNEVMVPIELVVANPDQPRRDFDMEELDELAASIATRGIIQPIIVRSDPNSEDSFQIVAGERRWRAAQQAQLHNIPIIVREMNDQELLEVAIIENIQRSDLNAVEEALGYRSLMDSFGHTQEKLSLDLGKSRSYIANILRLLNLPEDVQNYVRSGKLSVGHARALIGHEEASKLARLMIKKNLTVRDAEKLVKQEDTPKSSREKIKPKKDSDTRALEQDLRANLQMPVFIDHSVGAESGKLSIHYSTLDQLDDLCALLSAMKKGGSK